jgi:3-hydroxyisobutyrate dehydrogenase-like beta-hydroxyacid dehydrogenase
MDPNTHRGPDGATASQSPTPTLNHVHNKVGFVGLGRAGWAMAENLLRAGYRLSVMEANEERERSFAEAHPGVGVGARAFADVDMVITMLPNGDVVRSVLLGESDGLVRRLSAGTIVVDASSSDPRGTRQLGAELATHGITLLDAPVTRPVHDHINTRRIVFMVGGDEAAVDRVAPTLEAMAETVFRVGELGCGHAMKTLNNFVACAGLVAALDALMIGQRMGLDPETMLDVFNVGTARNFSTASVLIDESLSRRYSTGFQLALMVKDMGIAADVTDRTGFPSTWPAQIRDRLAGALADLEDPIADHAQVIEHWERLNGVGLPPLRPGRELPPLEQ